MPKKLSVSVAPLLAIAAFAVIPATAQAAPHWYSEGAIIPQGEQVPFTAWGDLDLKGGTEIVCKDALSGIVENPVGGGAGVQQILAFAPYRCLANFPCPPPEFEPGEAGPPYSDDFWEGKLEEPKPKNIIGTIGNKTKTEGRIKILVGCLDRPEAKIYPSVIFEGELKPNAPAGVRKGLGALHPGFFEFTANSGMLESYSFPDGTALGIPVTAEGALVMLGYKEQEHIYVEKA